MSSCNREDLISIEMFSGKEIGKIDRNLSNIEIQKFIQEKTNNKSHVCLKRMNDTILFGFIDHRYDLLELYRWMVRGRAETDWSLETDTKRWKNCIFEGTTLIKFILTNYYGTILYNIPTFLKSGNYKISHNHPISVTYILKDEIKQSGWDIMK